MLGISATVLGARDSQPNVLVYSLLQIIVISYCKKTPMLGKVWPHVATEPHHSINIES